MALTSIKAWDGGSIHVDEGACSSIGIYAREEDGTSYFLRPSIIRKGGWETTEEALNWLTYTLDILGDVRMRFEIIPMMTGHNFVAYCERKEDAADG